MNEILTLYAVAALLFSRVLRCGYCVDDVVLASWFKERKPKSLKEFRIKNRILYTLYGAGMLRNPREEHALNLAIHFVNSCLILKATSFMPALLFLVSPVNNQLAIWINGRRYAISILLALLAWNFPHLFLPAYALASWLHISAVALPVMFLAAGHWPLVLLGGALFVLCGWKRARSIFLFRKSEYFTNETYLLAPRKAIIYIKSLGWYFCHTIFPNKPLMYHEFLYHYNTNLEAKKKAYSINFDFVKGLAVLAFIVFEIIAHHNLWAVWWLVFISQYCGVVTVTMNVADRYCSLAGIGLMVILCQYLNLIPSPYREMAYTALMTFYVTRYQPLFKAYRSIHDFYNYHFHIQPDGVYARFYQADRFMAMKRPLMAYAVLREGLFYRPKEFKLIMKMALLCLDLRKYEDALKFIAEAEKYIPLGEEEKAAEMFTEIRDAIAQITPPPPNRHQRRSFAAAVRN